MTTEELRKILIDPGRQGAPEPTLLPWLTRHADARDLPAMARAAASVGTLEPSRGWPVIADAVAEILADRARNRTVLAEILEVLPPVAGHLNGVRSELVDWSRVRLDALRYAALREPALLPTARDGAGPLWRQVLTAAPTGLVRLPPLADLRSLAILAQADTTGWGGDLTEEEIVYLLPFTGRQRGAAVQAVSSAVRTGDGWYAAALLARAAPELNDDALGRLRQVIDDLPEMWATHAGHLMSHSPGQPLSAEDEIAAAHPGTPRLTELAGGVDRRDLAALCRETADRIRDSYGVTDRWEPDDEGWGPPAEVDRSVPLRPWYEEEWQRRMAIPGGTTEAVEVAGRRTPAPTRHVNIYVARCDEAQPVPDEPLDPGVDYEVVCNIGRVDSRSLVSGKDEPFPDHLLPAVDLHLRAVLFVDGISIREAMIHLPVGAAESEWVRLSLPPCPESRVIHAELVIYYEVSVVTVHSLTIPVGGPVSDGGPTAEPRYRLSRSLRDTRKLSGRRASLVVSDRGASPEVLVNGLGFAPCAFSADENAADAAARAVREQMYLAHFTVRCGREVNRYETRRDPLHAKGREDFLNDLATLANCGRRLYVNLFTDRQIRRELPDLIRGEAEAHESPPILQVVNLGRRNLPIPWAFVYDLPIGDTPSEYEPCPSLDEFGPGGDGGVPPARCPYEADHRQDGRWKSDQLCPWGFWGLSAIIEHPPHVPGRDLESVVYGNAAPVVYLMADGPGLDSTLRDRHVRTLSSALGPDLDRRRFQRRDQLRDALAEDTMDVVYFYCHVNYNMASPSFGVASAMRLGDGMVGPLDIDKWADTKWPDPHWASRHPLVVINGCHSVERASGTLVDFVRAFTNCAEAAGVIGTEIVVDQGVAGWAMELFLAALRHQSAGAALRTARWQMLNRGNLMGLAYTPYCLAGLTLRSLTKAA